jgi:hypothetical protein
MNGNAAGPAALDSLLESVSRCFDRETARALTELRPDEQARRRMEELGAKAGAGTLSAAEAREYDALIEVGDVVATLQLKARQQLAADKPA